MANWWQTTWKRVAISLAAICAIGWLIVGIEQRLKPYTEVQVTLRGMPNLADVPVSVGDQRTAPLSGATVYPFGLVIQTPWSTTGTITSNFDVDFFPFPAERVVMVVYDTDADAFEKEMWADEERDQFRDTKVAISSYDLMASELRAKPDQVKWWKTRRQNEREAFLLESKSMIMGNLRGIYTINTNGWRGFQEGNPSVPPYAVRVDLFDSADHHYQFRIKSQDNATPALSQEQLNAMIISLRPGP